MGHEFRRPARGPGRGSKEFIESVDIAPPPRRELHERRPEMIAQRA